MALSPENGEGAVAGRQEEDQKYLFSELAVQPPLEEFRRTYAKRMRSFESTEEGEGDQQEAYRKAFALAEKKIIERLGGEDLAC
mgnify:CR=1 FL=1